MTRRYLYGGVAVLAALLVLFLPAAAPAQVTFGSAVVAVQDPTGTGVPNAKVTLTNKSTGQTLTAETELSGTVRFPNVVVGSWMVSVEAQGFRKYVTEADVFLNANTDVLAKLEVGATTETVEVAAAGGWQVETTSSQLSNAFTAQRVTDLPIGSPNDLALLTPNVVHQGSGVLGSGGSVGGQRSRNNNFTVDGVDNNEISVTGPVISVIPDAVDQFTLLQNHFSAEYGHSSGGQFNTITKSGTNTPSGAAWWYLQNRKLNAMDHLTREAVGRGDIPGKPRYDWNRVGGQFGGPIIKDKLFYFGAFQYETWGSQGSSAQFLVPTQAGFDKLATISGLSQHNLNLMRENTNPASSESATVTVLGQPVGVGIVNLFLPSFYTLHQWQANADYNLSEKDQFHFRMFWDRYRSPNIGSPVSKFDGSVYSDNRLAALTHVHMFSPRVVNEFRASFHRNRNGYSVAAAYVDFPNIVIDELSLNIGPQSVSPQGGTSNVYQYLDNLSWTSGRHNFKAGFEFRNAIAPSDFLPRGRGEYDWATLESYMLDVKPDGGNGALRGVGSGFFAGNQYSTYGYFQDDWRATSQLTLNLGLRYEFTSMPRDSGTQALNALANAGPFDFRKPKNDRSNWAPRVGFAYAPDAGDGFLGKIFGSRGKSSIRGGFSISYDVIFQNLILLQLPPQLQQELDAWSGSGGIYGTDTQFLENGGLKNTPIPPDTAEGAREATQSLIVDQRLPEAYAWSLSFQRELPDAWFFEARYLGTRGIHLPVQYRRNAGRVPADNLFLPTYFSESEIPDPSVLATMTTRADFLGARARKYADLGFFANLTAFDPIGNSVYHAGSFSLTRRFTRGFMTSVAYTYSHNIDDTTNELFSSYVNPRRVENFDNIRNERGNSALDRRQRFVTSWVWELPWLKNAKNPALRQLGGWQWSGVYQAESGQWVTPLSFADANGNFDSAGDRTVINAAGRYGTGTDVNVVLKDGTVAASGPSSQVVAYVARDPNAYFVRAQAGAKTTGGRNTLLTRGINNWDFALFKNFHITESKRVQFRADMYNAFNHPQLTVDALNLGFILVSSPDFNDPNVFSGGSRTIRLALKLYF